MKKIFSFIIALIFIVGCIFTIRTYVAVKSPNTSFTEEIKSIYIFPNERLDTLKSTLQRNGIIKNMPKFRLAAKILGFDSTDLRKGYYEISKNANNQQIINKLKFGNQTPLRFTFNNLRTHENFAGNAGQFFLIDSLGILDALIQKSKEHNIRNENIMTLLIPDTYEFYWTVSARDFVDKIYAGYNRFWNDERLIKAQKIGLTPQEVYTLASIVEKESNNINERPIVAGLYLNRLKINMPLQADPTIVFANKIWDAKRVLHQHLTIDSPYNTYKYPGLPPGPIYMSSKNAIDAVLNSTNHDYLYMCAKPDAPGKHVFAKSLGEHNRNARKYQQWLNSRGIYN